MSDYYTVLIISTIHSLYGSFDPYTRFQHTIEAIDSVHKKIPNAKILFVDNSNIAIPSEWRGIIESKVTVFHQLEHNLFSLSANQHRMKAASEVNMMNRAFDLLREHNLLGAKRIFKLSGRYKISDSFDITEFDNPKYVSKFSFAVTNYHLTYDNWETARTITVLETALISFTSDLLDGFQKILPSVLWHILQTDTSIEDTLYQFIPHSLVIPVKIAHAEGIKADDQRYEKT